MSSPFDDDWTPAPARHEAALRALEQAKSAPEAAVRALGALSLARGAELTETQRSRLAPLVDSVRAGLDVEPWSQRVDELCAALDREPPEDGGSELSWIPLAREVLDERHRLELTSRGLHLLAPEEMALAPEAWALLEDADEQLRDQMWRLTVLNEHRCDELEAIAPEHRDEMWWYAEGAHLPSDAVRRAGDVAALLACFPEARAELEALSEADELLLPSADVGSAIVQGGQFTTLTESRASSSSSPLEGLQARPRVVPAQLAPEEVAFRPRHLGWSLAWAGLSVAGILLLVGGAVAYWNHEEVLARQRALLQESEVLRREAERNVQRLEEGLKNLETLSESQRRALEHQLEAARTQADAAAGSLRVPPAAMSVRSSAGSASSKPTSKPLETSPGKKPSCAPGDPFCGSL